MIRGPCKTKVAESQKHSPKKSPARIRPQGWTASRSLVHAVVVEDGTARPCCMWNQKKEKVERPVDAYDICGKLSDMVVGTQKICTKCYAILPASFLVEIEVSDLIAAECS